MIKTLAEYQEAAMRTAPMQYPPFVPEPGRHAFNAMVFALGLTGETGEVAEVLTHGHVLAPKEQLRKEIGDVLWYVTGLAHTFGLSLSELTQTLYEVPCLSFDDLTVEHAADMPRLPSLSSAALSLAANAGKAADLIKKGFGHQHGIAREAIRRELALTLEALFTVARAADLDMAAVAEANVLKLKARYPDGFSVEASINRQPQGTGEHGAI